MFRNISRYLFKYSFKSLYVKMLIFFTIVFSLSIVSVAMFSYSKSSKIIQEKVNEADVQTLAQIKQSIENNIDKVNELIGYLTTHYMLRNDYDEFPTTTKLEISTSLLSQLRVEEFIHSVYIYYYKSGKVVSNDLGVIDIDLLDSLEWLKNSRNIPRVGLKPVFIHENYVKRNDYTTEVLTMIREFPLIEMPKIGAIAINLDKNKFFGNMEQFLPSDQKILVIDEQGSLLYGEENTFQLLTSIKNSDELLKVNNSYQHIKIDNKDFMLSRLNSDKIGWQFIKVNSLQHLTADTRDVRNVMFKIVLICFFIGIIIWLTISMGLYSPIINILDKIDFMQPEKGKNNTFYAKNEMDLLNQRIEEIINQKKGIETLYKKSQRGILRSIILNLFNGVVDNYNYIDEQMGALGINIKDCDFIVFAAKMDDYKELAQTYNMYEISIIKMSISEFLNNNHHINIVSTYLEEDRIAGMICLNIADNIQENSIMETIKTLQEIIKREYGIGLTIGIGNKCSQLSDLYISYQESLDALNYRVYTGKSSIIHINSFSIETDIPKYYYPVSKDLELLEAIKLGNKTEALKVIKEMYTNIPKSISIAKYANQLLWQMMNGILRSITTLGLKYEEVFGRSVMEEYTEFVSIDNIDDMIIFLQNRTEKLIDYIDEKRSKKNEDIVEVVKKYIQEHFCEDLSLNKLASIVYMSPSYFSVVFKECTSVSISDYVMNVRMEKAKELLLGSTKNINSISSEVGFENFRTFLRAFKKYYGMTPSEYRKNNVIQSL